MSKFGTVWTTETAFWSYQGSHPTSKMPKLINKISYIQYKMTALLKFSMSDKHEVIFVF